MPVSGLLVSVAVLVQNGTGVTLSAPLLTFSDGLYRSSGRFLPFETVVLLVVSTVSRSSVMELRGVLYVV